MEDYERTNTQEWDSKPQTLHQRQMVRSEWRIVDRSRSRRNAPQKIPQLDVLEEDNHAEIAWRRHEEPRDSIVIPDELTVLDDKQECQAIAREHNAFLFPFTNETHGNFGIWGEGKAVAATKRAIKDRIHRGAPSNLASGRTAFTKIHSLTPKQRIRAQNRWTREVTRHRFRQYPPLGSRFGAIGTFHWPANDYRPEDVLGHSYEALDPIRMDCSSHIVPGEDNSQLQVMGGTADVKTALLRIRKTCFQVEARQISANRLYLLRWDSCGSCPNEVSLETYKHPQILVPTGKAGRPLGKSFQGKGYNEDSGGLATEQSFESTKLARNAIMKTISKLHYYRAHIDFRVRLGTFIAVEYMQPSNGRYKLDEFVSMIAQSQFTGLVTDELGDKAYENASLTNAQGANDLLSPHDAMVQRLSDVKPTYTAIFTFIERSGDMTLSMSWNETEDSGDRTTKFTQTSKKWTKLDQDTTASSRLIDVSLVNLKHGSAWHFDMQASQRVTERRLPAGLIDFADKVSIDPNSARKQAIDRPFVSIRPHKHLKSLQQRIAYRYRLSQSDYALELTRFQDCEYQSKASLISATEATVFEPRWSLSVHHLNWDKMLSANESMSIGEMAEWEDDIATWFPECSGPESEILGGGNILGFQQLLRKLETVEALVRPSLIDKSTGMESIARLDYRRAGSGH